MFANLMCRVAIIERDMGRYKVEDRWVGGFRSSTPGHFIRKPRLNCSTNLPRNLTVQSSLFT